MGFIHARILMQQAFEAAARAAAVVLALLLAAALLPLLVGRAVWGRLQTGAWLESSLVLGRSGHAIRLYRFAGPAFGRDLASLWNVIVGELAWVGPRPVPSSALARLRSRDLVRFEVLPGLVSLASVRAGMGLAHDGAARLDRRMALEWRRRDSPGLVLRAGLAAFLSSAPVEGRRPDHLRLLGVRIDDCSMEEAIREISVAAEEKRSLRIAFANPDCLN
ncbi:MAG: sugar transferase, partial [Holophagales bacterium]|nr:sugar transferase [Holophagales bacterium]